jgi:First Longin domain of INTU, CCZ1 and HPS4
MSASATQSQKIVPAQVGFLAIYNPSLGATDETLDDQIVYYSSPETRTKSRRRRRTSAGDPPVTSQEERNERLRKVGLAQAMVEFGRDFSQRRPVDTIETEKSRIILHELEPGWWLIAVSVSCLDFQQLEY